MKSDALSWTRRRWLSTVPVAAGCLSAPARSAAPAAAIEWPEIAAIDGERMTPASFRGLPVVVVFWATRCAFCRRHNAHVDKLYRLTDPRRLRILGIAVDSDAVGVRRYMAAQGYGFPVALDGGSLRSRFTDRRVIPMTCSVDRDGRAGLCIPGEMAEADVLELARLALPERR